MLYPDARFRILVLIIAIPFITPAQFITGKWESKFKIKNETITLQLNLTEGLSGTNYTLIRHGNPATESFTMYFLSEDNFEFELKPEHYFKFRGKVSTTENKVSGNIIYNDKEYPAIFIKTGEAIELEPPLYTDSIGNIITDSVAPIAPGSDMVYTEIKSTVAQTVFNYRPLLVWAAFWTLVGFLLWLRFRRSKKIVDVQEPELAPEDKEMVSKLLPIIRLGKSRTNETKGLMVTEDSLIFFRKNKNRSIAGLHDKLSTDEIKASTGVKKAVSVPDGEVERLLFEKTSRLGRNRVRIITARKTFKLTLAAYETPNLLSALRSRFGSLLHTQQPISFHSWGLLIFMFIVSLGLHIALSTNTLTFEVPPGSRIPGDIRLSLFIIAGLLVLSSIPLVATILDHIPAATPKMAAKKKRKDRSHSQPFRSVPASVFLKMVAIVVFIGFYSSKLYESVSNKAEKIFPEIASLSWYIPYLIVGVILSVSYSVAQRNPNKLRQKNKKKPILYLRSFADDRQTTLNLRSKRSFVMGVDPPYFFLEHYEIGERTWLNKAAKTAIRVLYRFYPLFLLRLMFGNPKETSEQQLGKYLSKYGFFIAIGKPGEKIVTTGASRMYVTNEEWQQVVLDLLQESSFVVLQPSRTKGVWWEVEQVFKREAPEKILLSLVNYHGFQDDYETFRLRMESLYPEHPPLPRSIGNESRIAFMSFNSNWEPTVHYLKNYGFLSWPFRGSTANLKATLKPYIESLRLA